MLEIARLAFAVSHAAIVEAQHGIAMRRQLARLGLGELADYTPDPGSPESTRAAAEKLADSSDAKSGSLP